MGKLYVCLESGAFFCHRCKAKGSWYTFQKRLGCGISVQHYGMSEGAGSAHSGIKNTSSGTGSKEKVWRSKDVQLHYERDLWGNFSEAKQFLSGQRRLEDRVLKKYRVGAAVFKVEENGRWVDHLCVTFPMYNEKGELVRHKVRSVKTKSHMRLQPKGGEWGFFGLDTVPANANEVVITEGEFDAMAVYQATGRPTISLPNGASSLPIQLLPALERFETIYLWMDQDVAGQNGAKQFSRKLGLKRCKCITTKDCKDANDGLLQGLDLNEMICSATTVPHEQILTFDDLREEVFYEFSHSKAVEGLKSKSLPAMNKFFSGLRNGELTIYSGHTGVGKTTLLSQLSLDYCVQGVPTLWGSFEVGNVRLVARLLRQFSRAHGGRIAEEKQNFNFWADRFAELPMYFLAFRGSTHIQQVIDAMDYANYVHDCSHMILDNLQIMTSGQEYGKDRFAVLDHAATEIRDFCTLRNVHVSLVVHPRKENDDQKIMTSSIFGSAKATQEADNLIVLQRGKDPVLRHLDVLKNRFNGNTGHVTLLFDRESCLYAQGGAEFDTLKWAKSDNRRMQPLDMAGTVPYGSDLINRVKRQTPGFRSETSGAESRILEIQKEKQYIEAGTIRSEGDSWNGFEGERPRVKAGEHAVQAVSRKDGPWGARAESDTSKDQDLVSNPQLRRRNSRYERLNTKTEERGSRNEAWQSEAETVNRLRLDSVMRTTEAVERLRLSTAHIARRESRENGEVNKMVQSRQRRHRNWRAERRRRRVSADMNSSVTHAQVSNIAGVKVE